MNSLRRMLDVLELVTREQSTVDVEHICRALGYAPASAYRYVRELTRVGLLVRLPGGYALGPRIIELDLQMRESDPLLTHCRDLLRELVAQTGLNALLSERYDDKVINIHQEFGLDAEALNFGRGSVMPMHRGATARIILAHLGARPLRRYYDSHRHDPDLGPQAHDWQTFSRQMRQVRQAGYCVSHGELDEGKVGLAAPIFDETGRVFGSVTLVGLRQRFDAMAEADLAERVTHAAALASQRIARAVDQASSFVGHAPAPSAATGGAP